MKNNLKISALVLMTGIAGFGGLHAAEMPKSVLNRSSYCFTLVDDLQAASFLKIVPEGKLRAKLNEVTGLNGVLKIGADVYPVGGSCVFTQYQTWVGDSGMRYGGVCHLQGGKQDWSLGTPPTAVGISSVITAFQVDLASTTPRSMSLVFSKVDKAGALKIETHYPSLNPISCSGF